MTTSSAIIHSVRSTLGMISRQFGVVGAWDEWRWKGNGRPCDAFLARRRLLSTSSDYHEVLFVPRDRSCSLEEVQSALEDIRIAERIGVLHGVVVDAFTVFDTDLTDVATTEHIEVLTPTAFWDRLSCIRQYNESYLLQDGDVQRTRAEYVPRTLAYFDSKRPGAGSPGPALTELMRWAQSGAANNPRGLLVVGERGSGKTWLLKRFQDELMQRHLQEPWIVPAGAYISLREYADYLRHRQGIRRAISHYLFEEKGLRPTGGTPIVESLISAGRIVLLLDGVDELTRGAPREEFGQQVSHLLDHLPGMARSVLTTRGTKFAAPQDISISFAGGHKIENVVVGPSHQLLRTPGETVHRPTFNLCQLLPFTERDTSALLNKVASDSASGVNDNVPDPDQRAIQQTLEHNFGREDWDRECIVPAILEISQIPASSRTLVDFMAGFRRSDTALQLLESVLLEPLIAFNLEADRASSEILVRVRESGEYQIRVMLLDLSARLRVLEKVAAYLLEQNRQEFHEEVLTTALSEVLGPPLEVVTSDFRAQTVFAFSDRNGDVGQLRFRSPAIHAYFLARHIFRALSDLDSRIHGLRYLGRYRFMRGDVGAVARHAVLDFLRAFMHEGAINFQDGDFEFLGASDHERIVTIHEDLEVATKGFVQSADPYSVWTRYFHENARYLDLSVDTSEDYGEWLSSPLPEYARDVVLVSGTEEIPPFLVGLHEVTNKEFLEFLNSPLVPRLTPPRGGTGERYLEFVDLRAEEQPLEHPLSWHAIHNPDHAGLVSPHEHGAHDSSCLLPFTNAYHLFQWPSGLCPPSLLMHPLVWPSFYVCAIYCNWRSLSDPELVVDGPCYTLGLDQNDAPFIRARADTIGYRLATAAEWRHAARGGDCNKYPWDALINSRNRVRQDEGDRLKATLLRPLVGTQDVRTARFNEYGIFGMIGNVREWASDNVFLAPGEARIVGATWALGESSFAYDFAWSPLPMGNTNLDVGFRVVRSLARESTHAVRSARESHQRSEDATKQARE